MNVSFRSRRGGVPGNSDVPNQPGAHDQYGAVVRRHSGNNEECPPQPVRVQASNYGCPVAEIGDTGEEEIPGASKEVKRKTCEQKKA